jgi:hypothetical protein
MLATDQRSGGWIWYQLGGRERCAVARSIHRRNTVKLLVTEVWVHEASTNAWRSFWGSLAGQRERQEGAKS